MKEKIKIKSVLIILSICAILCIAPACNSIEPQIEEDPTTSQLSQESKMAMAKALSMTENRADYDSDQIFANFRACKGGNLKPNYIFRGASPYLDNARTLVVNKFLEKHKIKCVISLSEDKASIDKYINAENIRDTYFAQNYKDGNIKDTALNYSGIDLNNTEHVKRLIQSYYDILNSDGNVYVHCAIGRDRTGVYCAMIEALAGASHDEIIDDYMESWKNYSFVSQEETPEIYNSVKQNMESILKILDNKKSDKNNRQTNYQDGAIQILKSAGMPEEDIESFINKIAS